MNKNLVFESERLIFKGITEDDTDVIVKWRSSKEIIKFFFNPSLLTIEKHLEWYQKYLFDNRRFDFIIICKNDMKKIGTVSIYDIDYTDRKASIGYLIGESEYQHKGYAIETVNKAKDILFEKKMVDIIYIVARIDNPASAAVAIKSGFIKNNDLSFTHLGSIFECFIYSRI